MLVINVRNVHEALPEALALMFEYGVQEESRNGPVYVSPLPVTTHYQRPWERVLFWPERDANPYMHFMEALWMLAGRRDVAFPATYAKQLLSYSDDGTNLNGAYGHRWRHYFGDDFDQLDWAIRRLRTNPNDRRVVIAMWDGNWDPVTADLNGKDVPCNTHIYLGIHRDLLNIQVNCRSNDLFWGCLGANAVHFSMLHEYLAAAIGVPMGWYNQVSFNYHAYADFWDKVLNERPRPVNPIKDLRKNMAVAPSARWDPYTSLDSGGLETFPMMHGTDHRGWDAQLGIFLGGGSSQADGLRDQFFLDVAVPIRDSHDAYRKRDFELAATIIGECRAADWRLACQEWLARRSDERVARRSAESRAVAPGRSR